jgi:hypothetical protein
VELARSDRAGKKTGAQQTLPWPVLFPVPRSWEEFCRFKVGLKRCTEAQRKRQTRRREQGKEPLPDFKMPVI